MLRLAEKQITLPKKWKNTLKIANVVFTPVAANALFSSECRGDIARPKLVTKSAGKYENNKFYSVCFHAETAMLIVLSYYLSSLHDYNMMKLNDPLIQKKEKTSVIKKKPI